MAVMPRLRRLFSSTLLPYPVPDPNILCHLGRQLPVHQGADLVEAALRLQLGNAQRLMTIAEAATYLGQTPKAIEHLIARGTIQVTKLDGKRQIDRAAQRWTS